MTQYSGQDAWGEKVLHPNIVHNRAQQHKCYLSWKTLPGRFGVTQAAHGRVHNSNSGPIDCALRRSQGHLPHFIPCRGFQGLLECFLSEFSAQ